MMFNYVVSKLVCECMSREEKETKISDRQLYTRCDKIRILYGAVSILNIIRSESKLCVC